MYNPWPEVLVNAAQTVIVIAVRTVEAVVTRVLIEGYRETTGQYDVPRNLPSAKSLIRQTIPAGPELFVMAEGELVNDRPIEIAWNVEGRLTVVRSGIVRILPELTQPA